MFTVVSFFVLVFVCGGFVFGVLVIYFPYSDRASTLNIFLDFRWNVEIRPLLFGASGESSDLTRRGERTCRPPGALIYLDLCGGGGGPKRLPAQSFGQA